MLTTPDLGAAAEASSVSGDEPSQDAMNDLLHWAIQHSDPDRLSELMAKYKENNLTIRDVYGKEVLDAIFKGEVSAMKQSIETVAAFRDQNSTDDVLTEALERLEEIVEQIDNAGNLHPMGGMAPLLELSLAPDSVRGPEIRTLALWTLGVAVQNNPPVQADLLSLGGLRRLTQRLSGCGDSSETLGVVSDPPEGAPYCGKLLFSLSSLLKNNETTQVEADVLGVFDWMIDVGIRPFQAPAVAKKAVALLDTVLAQNPGLPFLDTLLAKQSAVTTSVLAHVAGTDNDLVEKSLHLVNRLLALRPFMFGQQFQAQLRVAVASAATRCEANMGVGDEFCEGLRDLAKQADLILAARDIPDEEL